MAKKTAVFDPHLVEEARLHQQGIVEMTPLQLNRGLSEAFGAKVYLKREDLQPVRSYKLRGAYNRMRQLTSEEKKRGVVCASAGNHAQGVAFSCVALRVSGVIFMPRVTPRQKIERVESIGGKLVRIELIGNTFDEASAAAQAYAKESHGVFVHPFDDEAVIAGQGTVALECVEQLKQPIDYMIVPVGGGGLISGVSSYLRFRSPKTEVIGIEPEGAASMKAAFAAKRPVPLEKLDTFVDGVAVRIAGEKTFKICSKYVKRLLTVPEGKVCKTMITLYQRDGIVSEPAGALSVAALSQLKKEIKGKTVVCVISGGNNDISRYSEIIERSLVYQGLKHYFIINFAQRPGALRQYLNDVLTASEDITLFEYVKKNSRESGPALVGIELQRREDYAGLLERMSKSGLHYEKVEFDSPMFRLLI